MKAKEVEQKIKEILARDNSSDIHYIEFEPGTFVVEYDDENIDFSKLNFNKQGIPKFSFTITGGLNGNGQWEDYAKDLSKKFKELKDETGLELEIEKIQNDIADDIWTAQCFLYDVNHEIKDSWSTAIIDTEGLTNLELNEIITYLDKHYLNWDWYKSTDIQVMDLNEDEYRKLSGFLYDIEQGLFKDSVENEFVEFDVRHAKYIEEMNDCPIDFSINHFETFQEALKEANNKWSQEKGKVSIWGIKENGKKDLVWMKSNDGNIYDYKKIKSYHKDSKIGDVIRKKPEGYVIYSEKGKRLSKGYKTKQEAENRLKQIEMFKHMKDALEHPELYGKKIKLIVNNALSSQIDRMYGNDIVSRKVYDKNKIEYVLPYDGRFEYFNRRFHKKYDIVDSARIDLFEAKPDKGHYNIYYKGKLIGSADDEKEAEEEIKHLASRRYVVVWETSVSDNYGKVVVYAIDEPEAIKEARKKGGWEMPKDDNELLVHLIEDSFKRR